MRNFLVEIARKFITIAKGSAKISRTREPVRGLTREVLAVYRSSR